MNKNLLLLRAKELELKNKLESDRMLGKNKYNDVGQNMLMKNKRRDETEKTMIHRFEFLKKYDNSDKNNLSLLERKYQENNDLIKSNRKKKPIDEKVVEIEMNIVLPQDDKFEKLIHYADKYRIPYHLGGVKKSYKDIAHNIRDFEIKNLKKLMKLGLDQRYKEYGHYINVV
jgi:hypothetical protein